MAVRFLVMSHKRLREVNTVNLSDEGRTQSTYATLPDIVSRVSRVNESWSRGKEVWIYNIIVRSLVKIGSFVCPVHTDMYNTACM